MNLRDMTTAVRIERACARAWGIEVADLRDSSRPDRVVHPRMLAMALLISRLGWTKRATAAYFGFGDWRAFYAPRRVAELTETWPAFAQRRKAAERAL